MTAMRRRMLAAHLLEVQELREELKKAKALTRAERAVVRAAVRFAAHPGVHTAGPVYFRVRQLESARTKAKKARRP